MVAKRSNRRNKAAYSATTTPRHLWLAGLGLVAVARREAPLVASRLAAEASVAGNRAMQFACDVRDVARGAALTLGEALEARVQGAAPAPRKTSRAASKRGTRQRVRKSTARKGSARKQA